MGLSKSIGQQGKDPFSLWKREKRNKSYPSPFKGGPALAGGESSAFKGPKTVERRTVQGGAVSTLIKADGGWALCLALPGREGAKPALCQLETLGYDCYRERKTPKGLKRKKAYE